MFLLFVSDQLFNSEIMDQSSEGGGAVSLTPPLIRRPRHRGLSFAPTFQEVKEPDVEPFSVHIFTCRRVSRGKKKQNKKKLHRFCDSQRKRLPEDGGTAPLSGTRSVTCHSQPLCSNTNSHSGALVADLFNYPASTFISTQLQPSSFHISSQETGEEEITTTLMLVF